MDNYIENTIENSPLSYYSKNILKMEGIKDISYLCRQDFNFLKDFFSRSRGRADVAIEMVKLGMITVPEDEIFIGSVEIPKNLFNILRQEGIWVLSQLLKYPIEKISQFRGIGTKTLKKLNDICEKHEIYLPTWEPIKENFRKYNLPLCFMEYFFYAGITSIEDFEHKTTWDIYNICKRNYWDTMKLYFLLKKNGVLLDKWEECFIFEILLQKQANSLNRYYNIKTIGELGNRSAAAIENIPSITSRDMNSLRGALSEYHFCFKSDEE